MKTPRPNSNNSHLAGEYFVAAELYKRGFSVAMTLGNAKAIDLFAEKDRRTVNVQVKAISQRKNVGWPIRKKMVKAKVLYVFVCLNADDCPPTFFVATSKEVRPRVKEYAARGIINYGALNSASFKDRWDKIEAALRAPGARAVYPAHEAASAPTSGAHGERG
jgi:hypothetical protein